jgi:hypothetical protein
MKDVGKYKSTIIASSKQRSFWCLILLKICVILLKIGNLLIYFTHKMQSILSKRAMPYKKESKELKEPNFGERRIYRNKGCQYSKHGSFISSSVEDISIILSREQTLCRKTLKRRLWFVLAYTILLDF